MKIPVVVKLINQEMIKCNTEDIIADVKNRTLTIKNVYIDGIERAEVIIPEQSILYFIKS